MNAPSFSSEKFFKILETYHVLFLFLSVCLLRGVTLYLSVIDWDETAYTLVGREILHGNWPYSTAFDHKPVALYLPFAFFLGVFGDHPTANRLVSFFMVFGSAVLLELILKKHVQLDFRTRFLLVISFLIASSGFSGLASNTEHVLNFYTLAWLLAVLTALQGQRIYYALAGFLMALSFHSNYLTGFILVGFCLGYMIFLLLMKDNMAAVIKECLYGGGLAMIAFLICSLLLLAPIYLYGDIWGYFALQHAFITGYFPDDGRFSRLRYVLWYLAPVLIISSCLGVFVFLQIYRSLAKQGNIPRHQLLPIAFGLLVFFIFLGALYAAAGSHRFYPHYFILLFPTLVLLLSLSIRFLALHALWSRIALLGILLSFIYVGSTALDTYWDGLRQYKRIAFGQEEVVDTPRIVSQAVEPLLKDGDQVYVLCAQPVIYQLLKRTAPTKFGFFIHHFHQGYTDAFSTSVEAEVMHVLDKTPDVVILGDFPLCKKDAKKEDWLMVKNELHKRGYKEVNEVKSHMIYEK